MSDTFLAAAADRAVLAAAAPPVERLDGSTTQCLASDVQLLLVGPENEPLEVPVDAVPSDSFLGDAIRQHRKHGQLTPLHLPSIDATFVRFLLRFFREAQTSTPVASRRHRIALNLPEDSNFRKYMNALARTRVSLSTRQGYHEAAFVHDLPPGTGADVAFELRTDTPTTVTEVRFRAVERELGVYADEAHPSQLQFVSNEAYMHLQRLGVPPFAVEAMADGHSSDAVGWQPLASHAGSSDAMEARALCLRNAPLRGLCSSALLAELLSARPLADCWEQSDLHGCVDLSFSLARHLLQAKQQAKSKLKNFLAQSCADAPVRLKLWPGKDAVQGMAAWWLASRLVDAHEYTEPELYAVFESQCAYPADLGTIRKELVRRRCLEPPEIIENTDRTTTTLYRLSLAGMRAMVGEWRAKGVF